MRGACTIRDMSAVYLAASLEKLSPSKCLFWSVADICCSFSNVMLIGSKSIGTYAVLQLQQHHVSRNDKNKLSE